MANLWRPNAPGDDATGFNNFQYTNENKFHYYNFSTRLDWQIKENWKAYARVSRMKTDQDTPDFTDGGDPLKIRNAQGSKRNGWNIAADTVYMLNPTTSLNVRGSYYKAQDQRDYPEMNLGDYSSFWPDGWWQPYMAGRPLVYAPAFTVEGARNTFGVANFWYQQPEGYSVHGRFNKYFTKHTIKIGSEVRFKRGQAARFRFFSTAFRYNETAGYNSAGTLVATTGHPWASLLLGAMDTNNTVAQYSPMQIANTEMYAGYIQDDFKVNKNLTLNLGLRYEYEGGYWDPQNRLQQQLDLTNPIPGMQSAIDPLIPANIKDLMAESAGAKGYSYNGAFSFTSDADKRNTKADKMGFMPRIGLAWRLDSKSVFRAGYGRFITPTSLILPDRDALGEIPMGAFSPTTTAPLDQNAVPPLATFAKPFPQGLTAAYGNSRGRYTLLGDNIIIDEREQRPPISDRFNLSLQRELPGRIVADVTYMMNFVSRDQWTQQLNIMDPRLAYTYKAALNANVANPFFNYGTVDTFPGPLRGRSQVATWELLKPYPQYGPLLQTATDLRKSRYQTFQIRLQKPFSNGLSFMITYGYNSSRTQVYYDIQDEYDGTLTWQDGAYSPAGGTPTVRADGLNNYQNVGTGLNYAIDPKHAVRFAFTAQVPIGRGRSIGREMNPVVDAIVGGWALSGLFSYNSGAPLVFAGMVAPESATKLGRIGTAADQLWFDRTGFTQLPAYTRRSNPWYYDGLTGPDFKNLDLSLAKTFELSKRVKLQVRLEAYNALNQMNWANPTLTITSSDFGRTNTQAAGYYGRQIQYSARLQF